MTILARFSVGRILLHLLAMLGDRCVRFHFEGIVRELPWITSGLAMLPRVRNRLLAALAEPSGQMVDRLTRVDHPRDAALIAVVNTDGADRVLGVARYAANARRRFVRLRDR